MNKSLTERRKLFEEQKETIYSKEIHFSCPCCGYPTLKERGHYNICQICNWEDDGQDDFDADVVRGGPNHLYSLTEARTNFEKYLIMYPPEKDTRIGGADNENVRELKRKLIATFDKMLNKLNSQKISELWQEVEKIKKSLRQDVIKRIKEYEAKITSERSEEN